MQFACEFKKLHLKVFEQLQVCRKPVQTCKLICSLLKQKTNGDEHVAVIGLGTLSMHSKNDAETMFKASISLTMIS